MGSKISDLEFQLAAEECYQMLLRAGAGVRGWKSIEADSSFYLLKWRQSFWSLYQAGAIISVQLRSTGENNTRARFEVYQPAQLADPFGVYDLTLKKLLARLDSSVFPASLQQDRQASIGPIGVDILPEVERVQVAAEEIFVPEGVSIKVQRSRTVEHTIEIGVTVGANIKLEAGIESLLKAAICGEIERSQGHSYKNSETISYEVALNGDSKSRYSLVWTDLWRKGRILGSKAIATTDLVFRYRDRAELRVEAVE